MLNNLQLSPSQVRYLSWAGIIISFVLAGTLILSFDTLFPSGDTVQLDEGDVAADDIIAPFDLTYDSDVLLEERRQRARENAGLRYVDLAGVRARQRALMDAILDYIDLVRGNPYYSSQAARIDDLQAIEALNALSESRWRSILESEDAEWAEMETEIRQLLDRTIERRIITETDVQDAIANLDIRGSFSQAQDRIIIAIVGQLIVPTERIDEETTRIAQENAAAAISASDVQVSYDADEPIVLRRDVVTAAQIEALEQYGLLNRSDRAGERLLGSFLAMLLVGGIMVAYMLRFQRRILDDYPYTFLLALLFIEFLLLTKLFEGSASSLTTAALIFPAASLALLYTALVGVQFASVGVVSLSVLAAVIVPENAALEVGALIIVGSFAGLLTLDNQERTTDYFYAAFVIGVANAMTYLALNLLAGETIGIVELLGAIALALAGGIFAAGIAFVELGVISTVMNLPTSLRLIDLMRPDQPAIKQLLREAPGTFQHSLQVANLSELAAERIGANTTLVRVAAMYHDIGKTLNPHFFVENQKGFNPHDTIDDPQRSAKILISHVTEGDRMARRYRLPRRIRDFIREHHGTSKPFFYFKALEQVDGDVSKLNVEDFVYPGPIPQSKETGILKLADSIESAGRSIQPSNREEVAGVVDMIFQKELKDGQLDESNLTLNDLKQIREVFIDTLEGIYHTRIKYPGQQGAQQLAEGEKSNAAQRQLPAQPPKALAEGASQTQPSASAQTRSVQPVPATAAEKANPSPSAAAPKPATTPPKSTETAAPPSEPAPKSAKTTSERPAQPQPKTQPAQTPAAEQDQQKKSPIRETQELSELDDDIMADELTQEIPPIQLGELPPDPDSEKSARALKPSEETPLESDILTDSSTDSDEVPDDNKPAQKDDDDAR
jgi:cyclic-di-AMP phosphodiesterase PgpH